MSQEVAMPVTGRQILVALGNRYVLFGAHSVPESSHQFRPGDTTPRAQTIADEGEALEHVVLENLRISDADLVRSAEKYAPWDLELVERSGKHTLIEINLRERDLIPRDYAMMEDHIKLKGRSKKDLELWNLNVEKLSLRSSLSELIGN
jgi:hypothetical protein